jgi:hypothetical protein
MFTKVVFQLSKISGVKNGVRLAPTFLNRGAQMVHIAQRGYVERLGLDPNTMVELTPEDFKKGEVSLW